MAYCGPRALPHSVFLAWREDDQDAALAWQERESERCSGCGTFPEEWFARDGKPMIPPPYVASTVLCLGCRDTKRFDDVFHAEEARSGELDGVKTVLVRSNPDEYDASRWHS